MKKKINDILLNMQNGKICVGEAANQLLELSNVMLFPTSKESDIEAEEMAPLFIDNKASKKRNFIVGWRHCAAYHRMFKIK